MSLLCVSIIFAACSHWLSRFFPVILSKADQTAIVVSGPTTLIAGPHHHQSSLRCWRCCRYDLTPIDGWECQNSSYVDNRTTTVCALTVDAKIGNYRLSMNPLFAAFQSDELHVWQITVAETQLTFIYFRLCQSCCICCNHRGSDRHGKVFCNGNTRLLSSAVGMHNGSHSLTCIRRSCSHQPTKHVQCFITNFVNTIHCIH